GGGGGRGEAGGEQRDGEQAPAEDDGGEGVVAVEQRRLVVGEVGVEPPATEQLPRAHGVRRLVDVEDRDRKEGPAGEQAQEEEEAEEAGRANRQPSLILPARW